MEPANQNWLKAEKRMMNALFHLFFFLYGLAPVLVVPFLAFHYDNWFLLLVILFSYAGTLSAAKGRSLVILFGMFMIGFWFKNGFDIHHYMTFYFLCSVWGFFMFLWAGAYDTERRKGTLDSDEERLRRYADEITPKIVQRFNDSQSKKEGDDARSRGYKEDKVEDPETMFRHGLMFSDGDGVVQDHVVAAKWFRMAAEQGHAEAQHSLALRYENGQGVAQDYAEAARWYRLAAEQGNEGSQNNLGALFERGDGVTQDNVTAIEWYRKGADNGDANAASNFSRLGQRVELGKYNQIVSAFTDLYAEHSFLIGDCSDLPHPKNTIMYAICWVREHYAKLREETEDETRQEQCDELISNFSYLLTLLARDWQTIEPQDKDAIVKLNRCESFPDWALPLKLMYINDERASRRRLMRQFR